MKKELIYVYLLLQLLIYLTVIILEAILDLSFPFYFIHYLAIVINFLLAIYLFILKEMNILIFLGLFFTLIADFGLTILNDYFVLSVVFFIFTQICYAIYIAKNNFYLNKIKIEIPILLVLIFSLEVFVYFILKEYYSLLVFVVIVYISIFIFNIVKAIMTLFNCSINKDNININWYFVFGLLLFLCCDICVGLTNFELFSVSSFFNKLVWIFYIPSQVLIIISSSLINKKNPE